MKEELEKLITRVGVKHYVRSIKNDFKLTSWINFQTPFLSNVASVPERVWNILHNITEENRIDICETGKNKLFNTLNLGYRSYCGTGKQCECRMKAQSEKIKEYHSELSEEEKLKQHDRSVQTSLEKYGTTHPMKNDEVLQNYFKKNIEKYGVKSMFEREDILKKIEKTNLEKYGSKSPLENKEVQEKIKNTNLEKYGVEHHMSLARQAFKDQNDGLNPFQVESVKDKMKITCLEKFGVSYPSQNQDIKNQKEQTSVNNYGVTNPMASPLVQQIRVTNCLKKYGCENVMQRHIPKETFDLLNNKCWLEDQGKYLSENEIARNLHISPKIIRKYSIKHKIDLKAKSSYERAMRNILTNLNIPFIQNTRKILPSKLELDFYIPDHKIAIEICGLFHHAIDNPRNKNPNINYHKNKLLECEKLGIRLITIFEDEWVFRKTSCINYIKNILGNNTQPKIFARKCTVEEVSFLEIKQILTDNHIQGAPPFSQVSVCLKYEGKIVSVMCFSHQRGKSNQPNLWDLTRFCNNGCKVIGAAGKLFAYFIKTYNPEKVISFADARWSQGDVYYKIGFKMEHFINPDYWYVKNGVRYHKAGFAKSKLQNKGIDVTRKTEREIMREQGFLRIYDCGKYRFVWTKS